MDAQRLSPAPAAARPAGTPPSLADATGIDATLPADAWSCVLALRGAGVTDSGLYRLLRLRTLYRRRADLATDGLELDRRAQFARWLVAHGHLNERV
jgi:hypothetical protein